MTDKLPIIEELERAVTFSEIATWLTRCPLAILASHGDQIKGIVADRGFQSASRYVAAYTASLTKTRYGRFQPSWDDECYDLSGKASDALQTAAETLDKAAHLTASLQLAWHATRQPREADNAG